MNELTQCAKCKLLGCTRGPGFADLADKPPSMWLCWCVCHPINESVAAGFLREHLSANHGAVRTDAVGRQGSATLRCDCGATCEFEGGS